LDRNNSRDRARKSERGTDRLHAAKSRQKRFVDRATDGRCVPGSARFEDVVLDAAERQRDLDSEPEHQPIGISFKRDASMSIRIVKADLTWLRRYVSRWLHATPFTVAAILFTASPVLAEPVHGSLPAQWNIGAEDCIASPQPPLQVQTYEPQTFILRQNPCATFEANFIYLLIGSDKALLIDTGAVADPNAMPLAKTILQLLPDKDDKKLPLLVAHTHRHLDHRAGDPQFTSLPSTQVVPFDLEGLRAFFGFANWPNGIAHIDLGGRTVDVIPTPGHNQTHVAFYDDRTGILFSGDFLLPGRLLIEDAGGYRESAVRVVDFLKARPLTHILGGHIELNAAGRAYRFGSHYHPDEHRLELARADLTALPPAFQRFNGFYARYPNYILTNPIHNILALLSAVLVVLSLAVFGLYRLWRRRRRRRT
jgi:hydroxyacylglutathione hydrolase